LAALYREIVGERHRSSGLAAQAQQAREEHLA
jgi:hypothetical protein